MRTLKQLLGLTALAVTLLAGCKKPVEEVFEFQVTKDGAAVSGVQTLNFDGSLVLSFSAKGVATIGTETPQGWSAAVSLSGRTITIKAPAATDHNALENGTVVVTATSASGQTIKENIQVAVTDAAVSLAIEGASAGVSFVYGETKTLNATASNVATIQVSVPEGWSASADASAGKVSITAPLRTAAGAATEGSVTFSPASARGNAGSPVNVAVSIRVEAPSISFSPMQLSHVDFGSENTITATEVHNVVNLQVLETPKGWSFEPNILTGTVKIFAPAADAADYDGEGNFVVQAISATGDTQDYTLPVSVKGINNATEFLALAKAYNELGEGQDPVALFADYIWGAEVILNADINLSDSNKATFIDNDFLFTFNGKGHTITLGYNGDAENIGLFKAIVAPGKVCNLRLDGAITSTAYGPTVAALTCISAGGTFENVSSAVNITQEGSAAEAGADAKGFCAAITADEQGHGVYSNCSNSGPITVTNVKFTGGLIADIWDNTFGSVTGCSNTAPITGRFGNHKLNSAQLGGVVGNTIGSNWSFKDSFNSGSIKYSFNKKDIGIRAVGGFAGTVFGFYENCYNTGDVINTDGTDAAKATRRVGGFGGAAWYDNDCVFYAKGCYNTGRVSDMSNYVGGFVGILEEGTAEKYHYMEDCYNTGNVIVASYSGVSDAFGGLAGTLYNVVGVKNCRNEGKIVGVSSRCAGGLIGRAADYIFIDGCTNSGDVYVGAVDGALSKDYSPVVGGICGIAGAGSVVTITNSKNTGKITAMTVYQEGVQSVYAAEAVLVKVHDPSSDVVNKNTADEATVNASKGAALERIAKSSWNINTILGWLQ